MAGHASVVRRLLAAGASVDAADDDDWTPLHAAAHRGHASIAQQLLAAGASARARDNRGWTPLHCAAREGNTSSVVKVLLAAGAPLEAADMYEQVRGRSCLGNSGGLLVFVTLQLAPSFCRCLLPATGLLQTPLVIAAKYNQSEVAGLLLRAGAAVNAAEDRGHTALHMAVEYGNTQVIEQLLAAGANLEAGDKVAGWTPLTYAAWHGQTAAARQLIAAGASLEAHFQHTKGPLHLASEFGHVGVVEVLAAAGADLNAMDDEGRRPLHCAAGHPDVARLLVRLGASTLLEDGRGRTALEAAAGGDAELERALLAEASKRRCAGCGKQEPRLQRCSRCRAVQYCRYTEGVVSRTDIEPLLSCGASLKQSPNQSSLLPAACPVQR